MKRISLLVAVARRYLLLQLLLFFFLVSHGVAAEAATAAAVLVSSNSKPENGSHETWNDNNSGGNNHHKSQHNEEEETKVEQLAESTIHKIVRDVGKVKVPYLDETMENHKVDDDDSEDDDENHYEQLRREELLRRAIQLLQQAGVNHKQLCHLDSNPLAPYFHPCSKSSVVPSDPKRKSSILSTTDIFNVQEDNESSLTDPTNPLSFPTPSSNNHLRRRSRPRRESTPQHRILQDVGTPQTELQEDMRDGTLGSDIVITAVPSTKLDWWSIIMAVACVLCAAFCAGLIMGILSLDELMLTIKIRAGTDPEQQEQAQILLPLVKQRHLVLVSLLLLNFLADEALPLFLDKLVPTWMAIVSSVVLVVFVSEIIPSALFIGPDQLRLASKISPFAYVVIFIFYPVSYPIAKLLDWVLQAEDELGNTYNRGELSALVRIQYEGRLAAKKREMEERRREEMGQQHKQPSPPPGCVGGMGGKDNGGLYQTANNTMQGNIHNNMDDNASDISDLPSIIHMANGTTNSTVDGGETLHTAEVNMLQGALALKTITARDVCTKLRNAYTVPHDMVLDKSNVARIYGVGFSRVPVYQRNPRRPRDNTAIIGILMTRQLILLQNQDMRHVGTLPLYQPVCVSPDDNMIDLLHLFQAGAHGNKGGHMALVCEKPAIATAALDKRQPIPHEACVIGIITLEDVIEEILQEPIYDEGDREEKEAMERAEWAFNKWKLYVKKRRKQREIEEQLRNGETRPLLGGRHHKYGSGNSFFAHLFRVNSNNNTNNNSGGNNDNDNNNHHDYGDDDNEDNDNHRYNNSLDFSIQSSSWEMDNNNKYNNNRK